MHTHVYTYMKLSVYKYMYVHTYMNTHLHVARIVVCLSSPQRTYSGAPKMDPNQQHPSYQDLKLGPPNLWKLPKPEASNRFLGSLTLPQPWADPKSRCTFGPHNLHHERVRIKSWGIYFVDPPGCLKRVS